MRTIALKRLLAVLAVMLLCHVGPVIARSVDDDPAMADQAPPSELRFDEPFGNAWLGTADADVTLVVFADYACPACRDAQPVIDQLLAQDSKLRVVYRLLINEDEGRDAALTSLAVARTSADWAGFHRALDGAGTPTAKSIATVLAARRIDPASLPQLKELDSDNSAIFDEVSHNDLLISQRKGTAIPAWVIGDANALNGFELEPLRAAIAKTRAKLHR